MRERCECCFINNLLRLIVSGENCFATLFDGRLFITIYFYNATIYIVKGFRRLIIAEFSKIFLNF